MQINRSLVEMAHSFGAPPKDAFFKIYFWAALPEILGGGRIGFIRAVKGVIIGQLLISIVGFGALFELYSANFLMKHFWAVLLVLFALAFLSLAPIITAINQGLWAEAKAFGYAFVFTSIAALLLTLAYQGRVSPAEARAEFLTLAGVLIVGPGGAALPIYFALPQASYEAVYFEMVSALTTTGASAEPIQ